MLLNILKVSFLSEMPMKAVQAHVRNNMPLETFQVCVGAHRPLGASMGHNLITFLLDCGFS